MTKRPMLFVNEGKAAYPDVAACMDYFRARFDVRDVAPAIAAAMPDIGRAICWHMMGLYPKRLDCALTIHDYRSLSVGRGRKLKDIVKRVTNARPDIRLFQNDAIRRALRFTQDDRTRFLAMGVPMQFINERRLAELPTSDFVYIGSMLAERRCERMLDSFISRFGTAKRFDLYGPRNAALEQRYRGWGNIQFHGLIAQSELPRKLKAARVGVAFFPDHYPHVLQTPTKLMEYAALGMRVLANEHPQSRLTAAQYGLTCQWGSIDDLFAAVSDALDWDDNMAVDPAPMAWPAVIAASKVDELIKRLLPD